jgi:nitroreductase
MNPEAVNELIKNRRSIYPKQYTGDRVDDAIVAQMLENANWAPTHKFTEPWRFTVFTGEGLKRLASFQSDLYRQVSTAAGNFNEATFEKLATNPLKASHVVAIGMQRDASKRVPEVEEIESVACAVQNMYLTATAYGIGCYWGSGGVTYWEEAKAFFGLGAEDRLLGFLYIGTPDPSFAPKGLRRPIADKVAWVKD